MTDAHSSQTEELRSAHLYRVLAEIEGNSPAGQLFRELAEAADHQAQFWNEKSPGGDMRIWKPDTRVRVVEWLVRRLGPQSMLPVLASMKVRGLSIYSVRVPAHGKLATELAGTAGKLEGWHRALAAGGNLRAAVFGVNDGLVSNASLIAGILGAAESEHIVLISGVAGLLAGAFSMAAGEYVSVRSQRELYEYQMELEKEEMEAYPEEEIQELTLIYRARGLPLNKAQALARQMLEYPDLGLLTLAREELGINPDDLGSPLGAAIFSFISFALGAALPLIPFLIWPLFAASKIAFFATLIALFAIGSVLSLFSGRPALLGGFRMLGLGVAAGLATYIIGRALGVAIG